MAALCALTNIQAAATSVGRIWIEGGVASVRVESSRFNSLRVHFDCAVFDKKVAFVTIAHDMSALPQVNTNYWFYGCLALISVAGFGNLRGVAYMQHTFNTCSALAALDLRGFDPSSLKDLTYTFAACASLKTILVDASWALPSSGVSG